MSRKSIPGNRRTRNKSVTVKAAWIAGSCAIAAAIIAAVMPAILHSNGSGSGSSPTATSGSTVPAVKSTVPDGPLVAVRREAGFSGGCGSWTVAKPPQDVSPPPPNDSLWEQWVAKNNAIDSSRYSLGNPTQLSAATNLDVTIQGRSSTQVILTGIQFVTVQRRAGTIHGGVVTNVCGGPMESRYMVVDLDSKPIKIASSAPAPFPVSGQPWQGKPIEFPYYVTDTNGEIFKIIAVTHSDVSWYAVLFWSVNGKNGESMISNGSKPFETAVASRAAAAYGYNGHSWYVCPKSNSSNCALNM